MLNRPTAAAGVAALLILLPVAATTAAAQYTSRPTTSTLSGLVTATYDSTADSTRVRSAVVPVRGALKMYAGYRFAGATPEDPPAAVYLVFQESSTAPTWQSPHGRVLELWINDRDKIRVDRTDYLRRTGYERGPLKVDITEWVWATLPADTFAKIAGATKVEGRLGTRYFRFGTEQLATLRELASSLPATSSATANGAVDP
ncbi:MAG TPA: hypothetical protein VJ812_13995 [Gemmatimonadaceae bacterium]|nr:hypothetical protein [Gemmatimonadaceae bacterium]